MKLTTLLLILILAQNSSGQSVTISPANTAEVLKIKNSGVGLDHRSNNNLLRMGTYATDNVGYVQTHSNHPLAFATNNSSSQLFLSTTGNFGIGNTNPQYILDVNKRMRVKYAAGNTAGIWFSKSNNTTDEGAFFGNLSDTETGIFIGNSWRFSVNETGLVKIPNLAGSSTRNVVADASGNLTIGNATATNTVAFSVSSLNPTSTSNSVPSGNIAPDYLAITEIEKYDVGNNLQISATNQANFVAPETGVYHFTINLSWEGNANGLRIASLRDLNNISYGIWYDGSPGSQIFNQNISCDLFLTATQSVRLYVGQNSGSTLNCNSNSLGTAIFSGFKVN